MQENQEKLPIYKRKYLINLRFQLNFIAYTIFVALTVILAVFLTSNYFFDTFMERGVNLGLDKGHVFFTFLEQQKQYMTKLLLGLSSFYFLVLTIFGILYSHRVAGPIHRLNNHMRSVAVDEVIEPVKFRKNDFFQELAESYNSQFYTLHGKSDSKTEFKETS